MISLIFVALGGMAGAISRYLVQRVIKTRVLPISTMTVNLLGSFLLGWIVGIGVHGNLYLLAATGFIGAFTTFSTLNVDLVKLISTRHHKTAAIYFFSTYIGGLLSAVTGLFVGRIM